MYVCTTRSKGLLFLFILGYSLLLFPFYHAIYLCKHYLLPSLSGFGLGSNAFMGCAPFAFHLSTGTYVLMLPFFVYDFLFLEGNLSVCTICFGQTTSS